MVFMDKREQNKERKEQGQRYWSQMCISFETLNGGFRAGQSEESAKKSIKEFHLAQETKIVISCCMERRAWNSKAS